MAGRLKGKVAVVTAAGQGIGRAIAEAFVAEGATVYATDKDVALLEGIPKAKKRKLDVLSTKAVEAFAEKVGPIDILVNAAGYVHHGTVLDCDDKAWDFSFDLNVKSMHRTIKAFLPAMLAKGGGSIVNIASGAGSVRGIPNRYVYGATKAAVIGLTKAVAADFIKKGVRANAICPGTIQSPSLDQRIKDLADGEQDLGGGRAPGLHRSPADGPARHGRGNRLARRLSRLRRGELHHRPDPSRRWRLCSLSAIRKQGKKRMHILVLGGAGMVGRKFIERLAKDGQLGGKTIDKVTAQDVVAAQAPGGRALRLRGRGLRHVGAGRGREAGRLAARADRPSRGDRLRRGRGRFRQGLPHQSRRHALSLRRDPPDRRRLQAAPGLHLLDRGLRRAASTTRSPTSSTPRR